MQGTITSFDWLLRWSATINQFEKKIHGNVDDLVVEASSLLARQDRSVGDGREDPYFMSM